MISPPEHYHLFARKSLEFFRQQFGFRLAVCRTVHSHWVYYRSGSAAAKLPFLISGRLGWGGDLVAIAQRIL